MTPMYKCPAQLHMQSLLVLGKFYISLTDVLGNLPFNLKKPTVFTCSKAYVLIT